MSLVKLPVKVKPGESESVGQVFRSVYDSVVDTRLITLTIRDPDKDRYEAWGILVSIDRDDIVWSRFARNRKGSRIKYFDIKFVISENNINIVDLIVTNNSKRVLTCTVET